MLSLLLILAMLALFSLSIFVHELGHFLVARAFGMVADVFSIGMGKAIWQRKVGGTTYKIGVFPIGGYVSLPQMDPNSFLEGKNSGDRKEEVRGQGSGSDGAPPPSSGGGSTTNNQDLPRIAPWKKILVSIAGAAGNIVFAFCLATLVWWVGKPASLQEQNSIIGYIATNSPALAIGLTIGDEIVAINGESVQNWQDIFTHTALSDPEIALLLRIRAPDGEEREMSLKTEKAPMGIWILPGIEGMDPSYVASVYPKSCAEAAGLLAGDQLLSYNGKKIYSRAHLSQMVELSAGRPGTLEFRREGEIQATQVQSRYDEGLNRYLMGITFNTLTDLDFSTRSHPTPWAQIREYSTAIFRFLDALTTPSTSGAAAGAAGGPIAILIMLWLMLKASFVLGIGFTVFLNVNLAIINLLPLPLLDGGHVVMNLWEWGTGRPVPPRLVNALANVFAVLLLTAILILTFRDSVRYIVPPVKHWMGNDVPASVDPTVFDQESGGGEEKSGVRSQNR